MNPVILKSPLRIFANSAVLRWNKYADANFKQYEVYVGEVGFTADSTTKKAVLTDKNTEACKVFVPTAKTLYQYMIRTVAKDNTYADSERRTFVTADGEGEIIVAQDSKYYKAWPSANFKQDGTAVVSYGSYYYHTIASQPGFPNHKELAYLQSKNKFWELREELDEYYPNHLSVAAFSEMDDGRYLIAVGGVNTDPENAYFKLVVADSLPPFPDNTAQEIQALKGEYIYFSNYTNITKTSNGIFLIPVAARKSSPANNNRCIVIIAVHPDLTVEKWCEVPNTTAGMLEPCLVKTSGTYPNENFVLSARQMTLGERGLPDTGVFNEYYPPGVTTTSSNSAKNWSAHQEITLPSPANFKPRWIPHQMLVKDGKLYLSTANRFGGSNDVWLFKSNDLTPTWLNALQIKKSTVGSSGTYGNNNYAADFGYTFLLDFGNEIGVGYYYSAFQPVVYNGGVTNPYIAMKKIDVSTMTIQDAPIDNADILGTEFDIIPNTSMPFGLNSVKEIYTTIVLPMYSDAILATPDNTAGTLILNQSNTITKYIHNNTTKAAKVSLSITINEKLPDGSLIPHTFTSAPQTMQPGEARPFPISADLTGINDIEKDGNNNPICTINQTVLVVI